MTSANGVNNAGHPTLNSQSGTSYTLVAADDGAYLRCSNASAITLTVPPNSSVPFPIMTQIQVVQTGAGKVSPSPGAGVTLNIPTGLTGSNGQYTGFLLTKVATNTWDVVGNLV